MKSHIDIISAGEILIDCIGAEIASLPHTREFQRFLGGSPTNVAVNASRLGLNVALVATIGQDAFGVFAGRKLETTSLDTTYLRRTTDQPTSVIFVSRSVTTPDFIPYREADRHILPEQLPDELLRNASIFHTTCFALSAQPAQQTLLDAAHKASRWGVQTSLDLNYAARIWPDREEAHRVVAGYMESKPLLKISDDDALRFFGVALDDDALFAYFHAHGASTICLTKGKDGVVVSDREQGLLRRPAETVEAVIDATGAGDAFWTGFLFARLKERSLDDCIGAAQRLAAMKLQHIGKIPDHPDLASLL